MLHDVRIAARRLMARPGHTILMLLTLALGLGLATVVFSIVDQTILRPAPFPHASRLVDVLDINRNTGSGGNVFTPQKIVGWQSQAAMFERFEAYAPVTMDVSGTAEPERLDGLQVSLGLFSMLDVRPRLGRTFVEGEGRPGSERVTIISERLWRRHFGGSGDVLGQRIRLNDQDYTIVGVMPRRFRLLSEQEAFWMPVDLPSRLTDTTLRGFYGIGRLAPGVSQADAQALANDIADRLQTENPLPRTWGLRVTRKNIARVDETTRTALLVLLGAVGFVVLIVCANVANLFLSQAALRQREMAIRSALGAERGTLIRGVLAESVIVASIGGALGILIARWGVDAMLAAAPRRMVFMSTTTIELDGRVVAVAMGLTLLTGLLFGIVPALRGSRPNLESTLRRAGQEPGSGSFGRIPGALVVAEVAFAVVLLVGAALMSRTLINLHAIDAGFDPEGLVATTISLPTDRYPDAGSRAAFYETLFSRLRGAAGVQHITAAEGIPPSLGGITFGQPEIEGIPSAPSAGRPPEFPINTVMPGFFATLRVPILAGRDFSAKSDPQEAIVSKTFADRYFPNGNAIGGRFRFGPTQDWRTIVGVAGDVQTGAGTDDRTTMALYYPWVVRPAPAARPASAVPSAPRPRSYEARFVVVRTSNANATIPELQAQIRALDARLPINRVSPVEDLYGEAFARQRFVLQVMTVFAAVALLLTAGGLYGVLAQAVAQRTREIGIRMALGASPRHVFTHIVSRGMLLTMAGAIVGLGAATGLVRMLRALLYEVRPTDPASFASVAALLLVVGFVACWLPTRAAMRVDPAVALRIE